MVALSQVSDALTPDVSVIICTYNRISILEEALASVVSQDFDGVIEIIVFDDDSQDGTSEIISQKYPHIYLINLKQNVGPCTARNQALSKAKGKYIAFLDSDDLWKTNYLRTQIAALEGQERCFCVSDLIVWNTVADSKKVRLQRPNLVKFTSLVHNVLAWGFIYTPSSVVFPQQVFDEVGLFDETYRMGGDTELYARCLIAGYQPIFTKLPVVTQRKHDSGQMTDVKNLRIRKKSRFYRVNKLYPLAKQCFNIVPARRIYAEINRELASRYFREKYLLNWIISSVDSAYYASPWYTLFNMMGDIKRYLVRN